MSRARVHGFVTGRVQGVWFRGSMEAEATALGVVGWVRNLPDGRVEFEAEGDGAKLQALTEWARRGPSGARVTALDLMPVPPLSSETSFEIRPTPR
jgi:acylphosphatase